MRRLPALLLTAALLTGAVTACSDDGDGRDEAAEDTTTTTRLEDLAPPAVELVDPGAEPRRRLRLEPAEDCASSTTMEQTVEQELDGGQGEPTTSRMHLQLDLTSLCTAVSPDEIEYVTTYDDIRAPEDPGNAELYAALVGTEITTRIDPRGFVLSVTTAAGDSIATGSTEEQSEQLQQSAAPFPEEAVGEGAVWRVRSDRRSNGIPSTGVTEYTITRISGSIVEATVRSTLTYTTGPFQLSTPNGDIPAEVLGGELTGTGTMVWDLTQVTNTSDLTVSGSSRMRVEASDGRFEVVETQSQHVVVTPARRVTAAGGRRLTQEVEAAGGDALVGQGEVHHELGAVGREDVLGQQDGAALRGGGGALAAEHGRADGHGEQLGVLR